MPEPATAIASLATRNRVLACCTALLLVTALAAPALATVCAPSAARSAHACCAERAECARLDARQGMRCCEAAPAGQPAREQHGALFTLLTLPAAPPLAVQADPRRERAVASFSHPALADLLPAQDLPLRL